jgi:hypothetical protein
VTGNKLHTAGWMEQQVGDRCDFGVHHVRGRRIRRVFILLLIFYFYGISVVVIVISLLQLLSSVVYDQCTVLNKDARE